MRSAWGGVALLLLLIAVVVTLSVASVRSDSATSDEPAYIAAGMIKLVDGRLDFFRDEPPLMNSLSAAPLVLAGYRLDPRSWTLQSNHWGVGKRFLWRSGLDGHRMLFLARLPTIALFAALIATMYGFVWRATRSAGWALAAAALTGFCPNLMAHGRLATVDLALTFFAFAATVLFLIVIETGSLSAAAGMGLSSAAAVMSKTSGNILGPYFLILLIAALVMKRTENRKRLATMFAVAVVSATAFAVVFIMAESSEAYLRRFESVPRLLVPFAEYAANIRAISGWYSQGHTLPQFLMGRFSTSGWPHYYVVAFLLKTTIPALALIVLAALGSAILWRARRKRTGTDDRPRSFEIFALLFFAALFMAIAAAGRLDLGLRYVLPIFPFVYASVILALHDVITLLPLPKRRAGVAIVVTLIAWHIVENAAAYPRYISYFNETIGSKKNADRFLIDSNLDWGQDLRRLDSWCRENNVAQITVHYFGGADLGYDLRSARVIQWVAPGPEPLPKGFFALSRHLYRVSHAPNTWPVDYDRYLAANHARFITTVGGSINVYAID